MKRMLALALCLMLALSASAMAAVAPAGELPISDEVVSIDIFAALSPNFDIEANEMLKVIEQETNIHLNIVARPMSEADVSTTKNLLMASNDYPEMFLMTQPSSFTMSEILQYGVKDGSFIVLNDLIDKYGYWTSNVYAEYPDYKKIMYAPDGNIYGINNVAECGHCQAYPKMWVRTDWMEKLGLSMPTTTEEFRDMLIAFKTQDPNGNGIADEIPLTADVEETIDAWTMGSFLPYFPKVGQWINGSNYCYLDDKDTVQFSGLQSGFQEGLRYLRSLYADGLIDIAAFSQTMDQGKVTVCNEPYKVGAFVAMHLACLIDNNTTELYANYHAIEPVAGPDGTRYQAYNPSINDANKAMGVITDRCQHPEEAFRLLDYFLKPDVSFRRERGFEGIDWKYVEEGQKNLRGGELVYEFLQDMSSATDETIDNRKFYFGPSNNLLVERNKYAPAMSWDILNADPNYYEARLESETIPLTPYFYTKVLPNTLFMNQDEQEEFTELTAVINDYMIKSVAQFVTGDLDIDNDWEKFTSTLSGYGVDRMLELYQAAYDNYNR